SGGAPVSYRLRLNVYQGLCHAFSHFHGSNLTITRLHQIKSAPSLAPNFTQDVFDELSFLDQTKAFFQEHAKGENLSGWIGPVFADEIVACAMSSLIHSGPSLGKVARARKGTRPHQNGTDVTDDIAGKVGGDDHIELLTMLDQ